MPKKFKKGNRDEIITIACIWAIENIETMIDGVTPEPWIEIDPEQQEYIDDLEELKDDIDLLMQSVRRRK